jgi:diguanylate cyclase (GGDEF)-like protein
MSDRLEMLEGTLDLMEEGVAVLDEQSNILFWNAAASSLTGYPAGDMICRRCPEDLYRVDEKHRNRVGVNAEAGGRGGKVRPPVGFKWAVAGYTSREPLLENGTKSDAEREKLLARPTLVSMIHKMGHTVPAMLRKVVLRDSQYSLRGAALLFYPVEEVDALPHGETVEGEDIERSQAEMEDRLDAAHHQWVANRMPFGLLWITVDQARELRKTHGRDACEAMLRTVEQTLLRQMNPTEIIGRWGDDEFLVLTHERTVELLADHARRLAGVARTADFRWWGDRVGLTVSIGASQAMEGDTLPMLLKRARQAMQTSGYEGGNRVTEARGTLCSQS